MAVVKPEPVSCREFLADLRPTAKKDIYTKIKDALEGREVPIIRECFQKCKDKKASQDQLKAFNRVYSSLSSFSRAVLSARYISVVLQSQVNIYLYILQLTGIVGKKKSCRFTLSSVTRCCSAAFTFSSRFQLLIDVNSYK